MARSPSLAASELACLQALQKLLNIAFVQTEVPLKTALKTWFRPSKKPETPTYRA